MSHEVMSVPGVVPFAGFDIPSGLLLAVRYRVLPAGSVSRGRWAVSERPPHMWGYSVSPMRDGASRASAAFTSAMRCFVMLAVRSAVSRLARAWRTVAASC